MREREREKDIEIEKDDALSTSPAPDQLGPKVTGGAWAAADGRLVAFCRAPGCHYPAAGELPLHYVRL